jgi:hypothetical protein
LAIANSLLFIIMWPQAEFLANSYGIGIDLKEWSMFFPSIPMWIIASGCIGIASLGLAEAVDWGLFAFVSAAGSGVVLWVILFFNALLVDQRYGTLQMSMHAATTAILCIALSLSAGSISVISAVLWVLFVGIPIKGV